MRILQVSSAQAFGGGERHLADLVNALAARNHEVYLALRPASPLLNKVHSVPVKNVRLLPLRNALDVPSANQLAQFARQIRADLIHAHMARDYSLAAFAARRKPHAKLVLTRHVLFPLSRFQSRVFSRAARVIAVSEAVARQLGSQNLVNRGRITVVRNGIDVAAFDEHRRNADRAGFHNLWRFPPNSLVIGTVGELNRIKKHDVFLRAAAEVISTHPQARFVIVGADVSDSKETENALKKLVADLQLTDHVHFTGLVDEVGPVLAAMDVFVSSSETESFGLAMVEAFAAGLPVVATETEGAREIIKAEETGFLVAIGDSGAMAGAITKLLNEPELRARIGRAAYHEASTRFQLEKMVDAIEKIYEESIREV